MTLAARKPQVITAHAQGGVIILTSVTPSATYPLRHDLRSKGWVYNAANQIWTHPDTSDARRYANSVATESSLTITPDSADPTSYPTPQPAVTIVTPTDAVTVDPTQDQPRRRIKRAADTEAQQAQPTNPAAASDLMDALRGFVLANAAASKAGEIDPEKVQAIITRELEAVYGKLDVVTATVSALMQKLNERPSTQLTITANDVQRTVDGLSHSMLPTLIRSLSAGLHVWLAGPSGSGKTHGAEQAAQALGLTFRLQGAMTMAHELTGFVDAAGKYHETPFVTTFRNGGVILLDELDAGSNEALLALNAALANGIMCLPSGEIIRAHADFKCVGAANTFGQGATADYVGRTRIDAAFLQRFGARLTWGYDEKLETQMAGMPEWSDRVQRARQRAATNGLKVLITPRASIAGAKLIRAGFTPDEAANMTYLAGLSPDQARMLD